MSDSPIIFDPLAVIPSRTTTYRRDPGYWLDEPGTPHRDYRYVDTKLGERLVVGLMNLPNSQAENVFDRT